MLERISELIDLNVRIAFDSNDIEELVSDWQDINVRPIRVFLSIAETMNDIFLGWVGEFGTARDIEASLRYRGTLFRFTIGDVEFYGRAYGTSNAEKNARSRSTKLSW